MIDHSGIGVVLRGLLNTWAENPPQFNVILAGHKERLYEVAPPTFRNQIIHWNPRVYSPQATFLPPMNLAKIDAWYSPHYATCLTQGAPLVCHVQDLLHITNPPRPITPYFMSWYLQALKRRAKLILTTTRHVKVQLQRRYRFKPDRVLTTSLGQGVIDRVETPGPLPEGIGNRKFYLAVGIFKPHKNWGFLLRCWRKLKETDAVLVCLGMGPRREEFMEYSRKLKVLDRIVVLDHLLPNTMQTLYQKAEALIFPSLEEGFGLPVLEAMANNLPVLCSDRAPMTEILKDAGWYFDPTSMSSFQKTFQEFSHENGTRQDKIRLGAEYSKVYQWTKSANIIEDALLWAMTDVLPPLRT